MESEAPSSHSHSPLDEQPQSSETSTPKPSQPQSNSSKDNHSQNAENKNNQFENDTSLVSKIHALTKPNQPGKLYTFNPRPCGGKYDRTFQYSWFEKYKWIHYDEKYDRAFCFTCIKALQNNALRTAPSNADAFVNDGFCNWKKALGTKNKAKNKRDFHSTRALKCI